MVASVSFHHVTAAFSSNVLSKDLSATTDDLILPTCNSDSGQNSGFVNPFTFPASDYQLDFNFVGGNGYGNTFHGERRTSLFLNVN